MSKRDYYEVLGINKAASQEEIKKAFRTKAKELHPDRNSDNPNAEAQFKEANEAYDILKDEEIKVLAMCPGYVKTRMNGGGANLEPQESIEGMLKQINDLDTESSGSFVRYNGEDINW